MSTNTIVSGLLVMFSAFIGSFASAQVASCQNLFGSYTCEYSGQDLAMSINQTADSELTLNVDGEERTFNVDGTSHPSTIDDSTYVALCSEKGLLIENSFKKKKQMIYIYATEDGVSYSIDGMDGLEDGLLTLPCKRK